MIELLKKINILEGINKEEEQEIAKACKLQAFKKGIYVFKTGDPAEYLFMVNQGKIALRFKVSYHNVSTELELDRLYEGDTFGWSALTHPSKYTLSAFTIEDSELVLIKESDIKSICQRNYHLGYVLMNNIAQIIGRRFSLLQGILVREIQESLKKKETLS